MRFPIVTWNIKVSSTKVYQSKLKIVYDTVETLLEYTKVDSEQGYTIRILVNL